MIVLFFVLLILLSLAVTPFVVFTVHRINKKKLDRLTAIRDKYMFNEVETKGLEFLSLYQEATTLYAQIVRMADKRQREVAKALMDDIRTLKAEITANASHK